MLIKCIENFSAAGTCSRAARLQDKGRSLFESGGRPEGARAFLDNLRTVRRVRGEFVGRATLQALDTVSNAAMAYLMGTKGVISLSDELSRPRIANLLDKHDRAWIGLGCFIAGDLFSDLGLRLTDAVHPTWWKRGLMEIAVCAPRAVANGWGIYTLSHDPNAAFIGAGVIEAANLLARAGRGNAKQRLGEVKSLIVSTKDLLSRAVVRR